jgi:DNA-directed RNA polymerase specialized sigma24 family protein
MDKIQQANQEFVEQFIDKNYSLIKALSRRYIIPNRYTWEDVLQYIATTIMTILTNRQSGDHPIENPPKYFSGCLVYYMIEYQRMHGFIFCLPKRPRREYIEVEKCMKTKKFQYLNESHYSDKVFIHDGYMSEVYGPPDTRMWSNLTGLLKPLEAKVIDCVYNRGMSLKEAANELCISQPKCNTNRDNALKTLYSHFNNMTGEIRNNVKHYMRSFSEVNE